MAVLSGSHERAAHINISRRAYELSKLAVGKRRDAVAGYHGRQVERTGSRSYRFDFLRFSPRQKPFNQFLFESYTSESKFYSIEVS